ncbi:FAD-dependent oxidoreductase [Vulcanisaeta distributa]|uniref:FAD dependent oxidoreductase n=1 Tax=Vulcanisaeta distributa (strain DSM 14429 / JCM 11212 / NBRC 100878 / IC-017) TaxID=572478 RepID=E1QT18_VULDI|nr:FAD-dependent oxidoreductase [Vulcanisaeta distributa]ADN50885.1 FAD dependent oxidoreductase [Vulcanisaeta distributa DSM 14429]
MEFDIAVIGGGVNGVFTALDLALRGLKVVLLERGVVGGGTSGKMHGLLHSGARYVVTDPKAAVECAEENRIIARVAPHVVDDTGGYFVAITKEDLDFQDEFINGLKRANIDYRIIDVREAIREEPNLNPEVKAVVEVPDKVVYARELLMSAAISAYIEGALIIQDAEVVGFDVNGDEITSARVKDHVKGDIRRVNARVFVNAAGPWAGKVAGMAGISVDVMPTMGVMVVYRHRLTRRVINRMRPPSDGDILVPYGSVSIMGTTAVIIEDPDNITITKDDIEFLTSEGSQMVPALTREPIVRAYASVRPLISMPGATGREATRDFMVVGHEKPRNLVSVIGGKFTTGRLVGEKLADEVSKILGVNKASRTRDYTLFGADLSINIKDLDPETASIIKSFRGSIDEERGLIASLSLIVQHITRRSRSLIGWS